MCSPVRPRPSRLLVYKSMGKQRQRANSEANMARRRIVMILTIWELHRAAAFISNSVPVHKKQIGRTNPSFHQSVDWLCHSEIRRVPVLTAVVAPESSTGGQGAEGSSASEKTRSISTSAVAPFGPFLGKRRRSGLLFDEEIDFCLPPSAPSSDESAPVGTSSSSPTSSASSSNLASGASITRTVNKFANHAAKKILIGVDCCFGDIAEAMKQRLEKDYGITNDRDVQTASAFIDAISALSPCSELSIESTKAALQSPYDKAYERVVETLVGASCEFRLPARGGEGEAKVLPKDRDFCLSLYDTLTFQPTKTKVLNKLSNRVARTMLYGDEEDVGKLTKELESGQQAFLEKWVGGEKESDEALYYASLIAQLTGGLEAPVPTMRGGYGNAYQRLMTMLVQELGTRSAPVDGEMFDSFVKWETTLRKNLTQNMWDPHPKELTGQWTLYEGTNKEAVAVGPVIGFRRDGTLRLPSDFGLDGIWAFEPGPTHLDTIRFEIRMGSMDGRVMEYTGYVDRGQRIETRFSKRPVKMQGRVIVRNGGRRGEAISSSKFSMTLQRKERLIGTVGNQSRGVRRE